MCECGNAQWHPNYLVLMADGLVAQDLITTIKEHHRGAHVFLAETMDDALAAIRDVKFLVVAFVSARPSEFSGSALAEAIRARNGRVMLLGVEAERKGPSAEWDVLYQPFSTESVVAQLQNVA